MDLVITLLLLVALELILGIDNVVVISVIVAKLPLEARKKARRLGLFLALVARLLMLLAFGWVLSLSEPVIAFLSVRDLVLIAGGSFLMWKAVHEIHLTMEASEGEGSPKMTSRSAFLSAVGMIVVMDMVFAMDSVMTAFGMTDELWVIASAVILSFVVILFFADAVGEFVQSNPTFKILALSFLVVIASVLLLEGFHHEVPKAYIYLPMGFAAAVQVLQWRLAKNQSKKSVLRDEKIEGRGER